MARKKKKWVPSEKKEHIAIAAWKDPGHPDEPPRPALFWNGITWVTDPFYFFISETELTDIYKLLAHEVDKILQQGYVSVQHVHKRDLAQGKDGRWWYVGD